MDKPYQPSKLLPTGVPIDSSNGSTDPVFYVGNLLTIYGVPNAMKVAYVLKDYLTTGSLFSYIDLIKLTTEFGLAYATSALAIALGRDANKESAAMTLIYNFLNIDDIAPELPALTTIPIYPEDSDGVLNKVFAWFDYKSLSPRQVLAAPRSLPTWVSEVEPTYAESFGALDINPELFIKALLEKVSFGLTNELKQWIQEAYKSD